MRLKKKKKLKLPWVRIVPPETFYLKILTVTELDDNIHKHLGQFLVD
jgi:hypothetical protein